MGIQTAENATVLFDSVTGMVLATCVFEDRAEADAYVRWSEDVKCIRDLREKTGPELWDLSQEWVNFLADHDEVVCPFDVDRDSYGIGFTGDSDKSYGDYTMATPDACSCECHTRKGGVFSGR